MKNLFAFTQRISTNLILTLIFIFMILDYLLTYIGVNFIGIVEEANFLMVGLINLPLYKGILIRIVISFFPVLIFKFAENKLEYYKFRKYLLVALLIQVCPYALHIVWMCSYMMSFI